MLGAGPISACDRLTARDLVAALQGCVRRDRGPCRLNAPHVNGRRIQSFMSTFSPAAHPVAPLLQLLLPRADPRSVALLGQPGLDLCFNARSALLTVFDEIVRSADKPAGKRKVLLPAFHCPSAVTPAIMAGLEPVFYRIRRDLSIDIADLSAKCGPDIATGLIIHFFGQEPDPAAAQVLTQSGAKVVEDCSHSFLRSSPLRLAGSAQSDYRVFSFWKIVPSGVGGGVWRREDARGGATNLSASANKDSIRAYKLQLEEAITRNGWGPARSSLLALENLRLKLKPTAKAAPQRMPSVEDGEAYYPVSRQQANGRMPSFARRLLLASDLNGIAARRRENYSRYLAGRQHLGPMVLPMPELQPDACPWVMPVLLENRSAIDYRLKEAGVALHTFGIYLHSDLFKSGDAHCIADARFLAERLLCMAVHQDLRPADIDRSAETIETTMKGMGLR